MDCSQCRALERDPERMGGAWCFVGTRLAVVTLFEHFELGGTVDDFLEWFPGVTEEQVHEVLAFAQESLKQVPAAA